MLNPFKRTIDNVAVVCAHGALKPDKGNRLYALGAAAVMDDGRKQRFSSPIRYAFPTGREFARSGLSKQAILDAPKRGAVADSLYEFLADSPVVFVYDDQDLIDEIQALIPEKRVVDLGFAVEWFFPEIQNHTARSLWEYLNGAPRSKIAFTTDELTELALHLIRHIAGQVLCTDHTAQSPVYRHFLEKSDTLFGGALIQINRRFQRFFGGLFDPHSPVASDNWKKFLPRAKKNEEREKREAPITPVSPDHLETLFAGLAGADPEFTVRPEQVAYARHVAEALNDKAVLTIEAGTGTGKTQGYLLPALEFIRRNPGARVVVSTYTKSLQEQIFQKELVFTRSSLPAFQDIRAALLKGKASHVCLEKLDNLLDEEMTGEKLLAWLYCLNLAFKFRNADLDSCGEKVRRYLDRTRFLSHLMREASAGSGCTPGHSRCPAQIMTAEAEAADLVITNHHKLALIDRDGKLNGLFSNYIIDEANHFETAVRNAFGSQVGSREIRQELDYLQERATRMRKSGDAFFKKGLNRLERRMISLRDLLTRFREVLSDINPRVAYGATQALTYDHPVFQEGELTGCMTDMQSLLKAVGKGFRELLEPECRRTLKIPEKTAGRIELSLGQLTDARDTLRTIQENVALENNITAYQLFSRNWILAAQRVEVGNLIREQIYERKDAVVFTAATICHRDRFDSFQHIAGMKELMTIEKANAPKQFRFHKIPSPFSADAMEIVVPETAVSGKFANKAEWLASVVTALPRLIAENRGRTLVLFSSYHDLKQVAERLAAKLDGAFPLLIQKPGQSTFRLCEEFRTLPESVLFGVDTFWYGVDFRGDTLTQVIITRIPYPPPSDPLIMARKKLLSSEDYWQRYNYDTEIKLRQGMGRLIRSHTDRGKVVILDTRYRP